MTAHIEIKDILLRQAEAETRLLSEFRAGSYSFERPLVRLNPYLISPLAAVVAFRTEKPAAVTVTVRGKEPAGDISHTYPRATEHILPVLGLYADFENTVELRIYQGKTVRLTIRTDPLPAEAPRMLGMKTTAAYLGTQLIVVTPPTLGSLTGFDYRGDVRWVLNVSMRMGLTLLKNGHLLVGTDRRIHMPYYTSGLYEFDMIGKIYAEYRVPGGYHHDQIELPNGDLIVLTEDLESDTVEDQLVQLHRETGDVKKVWNMKDILRPGEGRSGKYTPADWFHNNALCYDPETDSLTLSARHIDALVNIDYETGRINWILGDPDTWPEDKRKYFFRPEGDSFAWQYAQHACVRTPDGDYMCFDNGTLRSKRPERYLANKDNYSRGVRFRIDTEARTIRQVWEFGRELGPDLFSQHISNVEYYADGHYMIHSGGKQFLNDVPPDDILPNREDPSMRRESLTLEVYRNEVMLEMRINGNYFRAKKLPLYHGSNLELGAGRQLGNLAVTPQSACPVYAEAKEPVPEACMLHVIEEADRMEIKGRFEKGSDVYVVLRGADRRAYRVDTGESKYWMLMGGPYIPADQRNTSVSINKNGLRGPYAVELVIDGRPCASGVTVQGEV